jgi:hypothetical protein
MKGLQSIAALTVYDFGMARILEGTGVPLQDEQERRVCDRKERRIFHNFFQWKIGAFQR